MAGGLGPPEGLDAPPLLPPDAPLDAEGWAEVRRSLGERDRSAGAEAGGFRRRDPGAVERAAKVIELSMSAHREDLLHLGIATLDAMIRLRGHGTSVTVREQAAWFVLVAEANGWQGWDYVEYHFGRLGGWRDPYGRPWGPATPGGRDVADALADGLLFKVPAPMVPGVGAAPTLGDHLALAMADPRYVENLGGTRDALPLYLTALAIAAAGSWDFRAGILDRG